MRKKAADDAIARGENTQIEVRVAQLRATWTGTPEALELAIKAMREKAADDARSRAAKIVGKLGCGGGGAALRASHGCLSADRASEENACRSLKVGESVGKSIFPHSSRTPAKRIPRGG